MNRIKEIGYLNSHLKDEIVVEIEQEEECGK